MTPPGVGAEDEFAALRSEFFPRYLTTQPEEATTLGLHHLDDRLKDCSPDALDAELALHREVTARLDRLRPEDLSADAALDRACLLALSRFHVHSHEDLGAHLRNVELSVYPHSMLQYQIAQAVTPGDWDRIGRRTERIPAFLRQQEDNLARGVAARRAPDRTLLHHVIQDHFPGILGSFERLASLPREQGVALSDAAHARLSDAARAAREALAAHAELLRREVLPAAGDSFALGEDEYRWRLEHTFGISASPAELAAEAEAILADVQAEVVRLAARVAAARPGAPARVSTLADARAVVLTLEAVHPARDADVIPLYRALVDRATHFIQEQRLFRVPEGFDLGLIPPPPTLAEAGATNWPAPLLDPKKRGHFLVSPVAAMHSIPRAANLAVHEGIPGHYLQSLAWQRAFYNNHTPVRFLLVADDVAMARNYYAPMLNIEGFAVYAEELMRQHGFYSDEEALFALVAHLVRAARVVVDIGLHTGRMTPDQAARTLAEGACLTYAVAQKETLRYMRIPMQAITYLIGRLEIERLKADEQRELGSAFDEADFHEKLFSFGPVPPGLIRGLSCPVAGA